MTLAALIITSLAIQAVAQVRIMPLGDSLTSSLDAQVSYRYYLWQKLQAKGYQVDFVGTLWGVGSGVSASADFDQNHEGHLGASTAGIAYGIGDWASATQPDIVLLLIGANDLEQGFSPSETVTNVGRIIDVLRTVNPNIAVVVGTLPPISGQEAIERVYNSALSRHAGRWSKPNSPVRLANLWSGYSPEVDTSDGEHPNDSGEEKIANRFFSPLRSLLARFKAR